jgi:D-alanine-D-alanine ligase
MRIAVVHNAIVSDCTPDEQDVLAQSDAVSEALRHLGHKPVRLACSLNLASARSGLLAIAPQMVFNLVESLEGTGRLIHLFPSILDAMGLPYTGACSEALMLTSNKLLAKHMLESAGLPTPHWITRGNAFQTDARQAVRMNSRRWIIKSVWEHASIGLDAEAIVDVSEPENMELLLKERAPRLGGSCFAEAFIDGREFNLSLLDGPGGVIVLPPAEILFEGYGLGQARIVDYQAKWDDASFQYHHTPRRFDFDAEDDDLLEQLRSLALACWQLFNLRGYARVDFRVDDDGRPWILEINANPCLSPDAGFAAAVHQSELTYTQAVSRIIDSVVKNVQQFVKTA